MTLRQSLMASLLACCSTMAYPALAQVGAASPTQTQPSAGGGGGDVEEVVVTARRRSELLQKVPVSAQAFTAAKLVESGVRDTAGLVQLTPSMNSITSAGTGNASPNYELRGLSQIETLATQDPAVGVYVNEVYQARPIGTNQPLLDVANAQVLLGPQGTLFGRNSTGGAVLLTTNRPTDAWEGEVGATIGDYNRFDYHAILNLPLTEKFKLRIAGQRLFRDGYTKDLNGQVYDNQDAYSARVSALFTSDSVENLTVFDTYRQYDNGTAGVLTELVPIPPIVPGTAPVVSEIYPNIIADLAAQQARGPRTVSYDAPNFIHARAWGIDNITTYDLSDALTIKNIFGFRGTAQDSLDDVDATTNPVIIGDQNDWGHQLSDELQLQGKVLDDSLTFIAGLYYFRESGHETAVADYFLHTPAAEPDFITDTDATNVSKSIFGQGTYAVPFVEGLNLTVGARFTWDTRTATYRPFFGPYCVLDPALQGPGGNCSYTGTASFSEPTYNLSLDYQINPDAMVYIAQRRGYRSGGFDPRALTVLQAEPFRPETVEDVEIGAKNDWKLGGDVTLRTDLALYNTWISDLQEAIVQSTGNGSSVQTVIRNAAEATVKGLEFNASLKPTRWLALSAYWGYVDASFDTFQSGGVTYTDIPFGVARNTFGAAVAVTAIDGPDTGVVTGNLNYSHRGSYRGKTDLPLLTGFAPADDIVNVSLNWDKIFGSGFSGRFFVDNLFDETYVTGILTLQTSLGYTTNFYGPPRMFGASVKYEF